MTEKYQSFLNYIRCELNLSARTVLSYTYDLRQWEAFATATFGTDFDTTAPTSNDLRMWVARLASDGVSQRSIRRKIQTLRAFFAYMMKRRGALTNPAAELQPGRMSKPLPRVVPPSQTARVLDTDLADPTDFEQVRDHLIVDMLYSTGMRASELAGLRDCDVNTAAAELKVVGKRNKERIIPYSQSLADMISRYRSLRPDTPTGAFFVLADGSPIAYRHVNATVKREFAGTDSHPTPHALRHSCATDMLNAGASLAAVRELLGHASLATTQIYTHLSTSELKHNYKLAHPRAQKKS